MKNPKLISSLVLAGVLLVLASFEVLGSMFKTGMQIAVFSIVLLTVSIALVWLRAGKNR
jgi:hypothetical protein